jgi:hypothetical protein
MDTADTFSTLDDFLLSLADGVTQAQEELARAGAIGPPGRQFAYHLPRVEFELKMNLRVVEDAALSARYHTLRPVRTANRHLLFKPLAAEEAASTMEIAATVRGAFVAVPANDGLPSAIVRTLVAPGPPPTVTIVARNAAGEPLAGMEVEVNLDREESATLTRATGRTLVLAPGTGFARGVVTTDADGVARATLNLGAGQGPGLLALVIDTADRTETLVYEVRA